MTRAVTKLFLFKISRGWGKILTCGSHRWIRGKEYHLGGPNWRLPRNCKKKEKVPEQGRCWSPQKSKTMETGKGNFSKI